MFRLRYYQHDARDAIRSAFERYRSTACVMPTASGKTELFLSLAVEEPGRVLVLVHRDYLISSPVARLARVGFTDVAVEKAEQRSEQSGRRAQIVFASVQSIGPVARTSRLESFDPRDFTLLIIDEGHRAVSASYRRVKEYFEARNPRLKTLILTATPKRKDGLALGNVCESVAYEMTPAQAAMEGWIVPPRFYVRDVPELDFSKINLKGSDLDPDQVAELLTEEEPLHKVCASLAEDQGPTIVFCPKVVVAQVYAATISKRYRHGRAVAIHQDSTDEEMERATKGLADGSIDWVFNVDKLCLDANTEVLTSSGWVGIDQMTYHHEIANWCPDGTIFFSKPKDIVRRRRFAWEDMVVLAGSRPRMDIRVTQFHRMVNRHSSRHPWKLTHAQDLSGKTREFPVCGLASPAAISVAQSPVRRSSARVRQTAYVLRRNGMDSVAAQEEAGRRVARRDALRYADPAELSLCECELIGFWLGDGSVNHPRRGGREYTLCQAAKYVNITSRVDALLSGCGIQAIRRTKVSRKGTPYYVWSLPRGTGSGPQARAGVYRIEPYLKKGGTSLLWGLNRQQLLALLRGFWMADGCPHHDKIDLPASFRIVGTNKDLLDTIQAVAVCRGLSVGVIQATRQKPHHKPAWYLRVYDRTTHKTGRHPMRIENSLWVDERIWCVSSDTGNIIIRRNGTVMVTGNTEGYDVPRVIRVAWAAPTASLVRWTQGCGRAFRPDASVAGQLIGNREDAPARRLLIEQSPKPYCSIVTYYPSNCQHQICTAVDLLGGTSLPPEIKQFAEEVQEATARQGTGSNTEEDIETARVFCDLRAALEERRRHIKAKALVQDSEYDGLGGSQSQHLRDDASGRKDSLSVSFVPWPGELATEKQQKWLRWKGISPDIAAACSKWQASVVRDLYELGVSLERALGYSRRQALKVRDELRVRKGAAS